MPTKARKKRIAERNAELQLRKTNPEKLKLLQQEEAADRERRNKRDEEEKAALNSKLEKEKLFREEEYKRQKLLETEKKKKRIIEMWERVRAIEISTGGFLANFRIGSVLNEQSLIATLLQEVDVVTVEMMTLLWIIFSKGKAYISSSDLDANTSILDQYKDCNDYTVMFEGRSQEIGTYPFRGKVVFGTRIGEEVNFSDTDVPHLVLPGCVMKKLITAGIVTPVL
jgi:hypothetical protein